MKKAILYLIVLFISTPLIAQEESSWWVFGNEAAVEFTPNPQNRSNEAFVLNSGFATNEGVGTISDPNGNLLFFTDGSTVYNAQGNVMPNGTGLLGNGSSTQSAIIVKAPETPDVYFIFTVGTNGPVAYSRVDMTLNGGLGAVVSGIKNIILLESSAEKIAATIQTGSNNAYVMTFAERNATSTTNGTGNYDSLFAWEVRGIPSAGVSFVFPTPIAQAGNGNLPYFPATLASIGAANGMLRVSPDGTKLAIGNNNFGTQTTGSGCFLYEFNPGNGQFGGTGLALDDGPVYGVEFSATSQYLYCETGGRSPFPDGSNKEVFQYDLCDPANILSTKNTLTTTAPNGRGTLQLGKDGIIYAARRNASFLGAIINANSASASYVSDYLDISPGVSEEGLPVFIQSNFESAFEVEDQCQGDATEFILACLPQVAASTWDFGDGTVLPVTGSAPVFHTYATAGTYTVQVNVTNVSGDVRDFTQDITIYENGIVDPIDVTLLDYCDDDGSGSEIIDLTQFTADVLGTQDAGTFTITYHNTQADAAGDINDLGGSIDAPQGSTTIWVRIANSTSPIDDACSAIGSFDITVSSVPTVSNIPDFEICDDASGDGIEDFDLASYLTTIANIAGNPADTEYSIYEDQMDAAMAINAIDTSIPYSNTSNPQTLYVRLQNTNDVDCFGSAEFNLVVFDVPTPGTPADIEVCDDAPLDGNSDFILTDQDATVVGSLAGATVSYHSSQADAESGNAALTSPYSVTNTETIFVRLVTDEGCVGTTNFQITVLAAPAIGSAPDLTNICDDSVSLDQNRFDLSVQDASILNGLNASDYTITYYTTDSDAQNDINAIPLDYVIPFQANVSSDLLFARLENNVTGCFNTSQFTILFERCEIVFPEGFSPNGDGVNDTFSIPGLAEQFDNFVLKVFNRHGVEVYETRSSNYSEFAGIPNKGILSNDGLLPVGTYFYVIQYNDPEVEDTASWVYINY